MEASSFDLKNVIYNTNELETFFKSIFKENFLDSLPKIEEHHVLKIFLLKVFYIPLLITIFYFLSLTGIEPIIIEIIFNLCLIFVFISYFFLTETLLKWQIVQYGLNESEKVVLKVNNAHGFYHYNHHFILLFMIFLLVNLGTALMAGCFYIFGYIKIFYHTRRLDTHVHVVTGSYPYIKTLIPYPARMPVIQPVSKKRILLSTSLLLDYYSEKPDFPITEPLILYFGYFGRLIDTYRAYHVFFIQALVPILISIIVRPFIPGMFNDQLFFVLLFSYMLFIPSVTMAGWLLNYNHRKRIQSDINRIKVSTDSKQWKSFEYLNKGMQQGLKTRSSRLSKLITYYLGVFSTWVYISESVNSLHPH